MHAYVYIIYPSICKPDSLTHPPLPSPIPNPTQKPNPHSLHLTPHAAHATLALLSLFGGALGGTAALTRVYSVQIIITPKEGVPPGEWARAASAVCQWWHTAVMAALVLVVVR